MENTKDNELIAEFLGWKRTEKGWLVFTNTITNGYGLGMADELLFHSDWNWLIIVVKEVQKHEQVYLFDDTEVIDDLDDALNELDIDKVYKGVVKFIEYHNENK